MLDITIYNDNEKLIPTVSFDAMIFFRDVNVRFDLKFKSNSGGGGSSSGNS